MKNDSCLYWIWLADKFGVASKEFAVFAERFRDPYEVYGMTAEELGQIDEISQPVKERLDDKTLEKSYSILKYCKRCKIDVIGYWDRRYPERLKTIENPPVLLYCMGKLPNIDDALCIGMVGTRKMSEYGKRTAYKIAYELAAANACIVSGMALGIDGVCACGAIEGGGTTVAVLGSGLAVIYPREHERLMHSIVRHGAVISEYPPFERPQPQNFPIRNRIISGLCQGVAVVEGPHRSGALITASRAIAQGRELFAVPGNLNEQGSEGPNELIREGANVVLSSEDILYHYDFLYHDVINYGKLFDAKQRSELSDKVLKAYGISSARLRGVPENSHEYKAKEAQLSKKVDEAQKNGTPSDDDAKARQESLASLENDTFRIYEMLPDGVSFTPDVLTEKGVSVNQAMTALTLLEISGLVISLPGGVYKKL